MVETMLLTIFQVGLVGLAIGMFFREVGDAFDRIRF